MEFTDIYNVKEPVVQSVFTTIDLIVARRSKAPMPIGYPQSPNGVEGVNKGEYRAI